MLISALKSIRMIQTSAKTTAQRMYLKEKKANRNNHFYEQNYFLTNT